MPTTKTARQLVTRALKLAQILAAGEAPAAEDAQTGLDALNAMLDSWETSRIYLHQQSQITVPLTAGVGTYSVGAGQTINVSPVPIGFNFVTIRSIQNPAQPLDFQLQRYLAEEWAEINLKNLGNTWPTAYWYDYGPTTGSLNIWPLPSTQMQLILGYVAEFNDFTTLDVSATYPSGYEDAIIYSLAERMCVEFGRPIPPDIKKIAADSRAAVLSTNLPEPKLKFEYGLGDDQMTSYAEFLRG